MRKKLAVCLGLVLLGLPGHGRGDVVDASR